MSHRLPFSHSPLSESTLLELYKVTVEEQRRQDEDHRRNAQVLLGVLTALIGVIGYLYDKQVDARPLILIVGGLFVFVLAFLGWWAHIHDYERVHKTVSVRVKLEGDLGMESPAVRENAARWPGDPYIHPADRGPRDRAEPEGAGPWYAELIHQRWWKCWQSWLFYLFMFLGLAISAWKGLAEEPLTIYAKVSLCILAALSMPSLFLRFRVSRQERKRFLDALKPWQQCLEIVFMLLVMLLSVAGGVLALATTILEPHITEIRIALTILPAAVSMSLLLTWYAREKRKVDMREGENELKKQTGEAAKKIWWALKEASDSMTKSNLAEETNLDEDVLNQGIGWLARGGKIEYGAKTDTLKLKD